MCRECLFGDVPDERLTLLPLFVNVRKLVAGR
jgi:hypothetical protein